MKDDVINEELSSILREDTVQIFESVLREAFSAKHDLFVHSFVELLAANTELASKRTEPASVEADWQEIESLSRLRSIVGGRFQNLKSRWLAAGLPLREHRGDKSGEFELNQEGWIELSNWILKQGFESRLTPEKSGVIFELREIGNKN